MVLATYRHNTGIFFFFFIDLFPTQFLSVPYNHWTSHDYGQTAPVKERHVLKKAIQYFEKEAAWHVITDVTATSKMQHKAKLEDFVH